MSAPADIRRLEHDLEQQVSVVIRAMPFLWLAVDDEAGPKSVRRYVERNSIALLSNFGRQPVDDPSEGWLGRWCTHPDVGDSGLWNSDHIRERHDPIFLTKMEGLIAKV